MSGKRTTSVTKLCLLEQLLEREQKIAALEQANQALRAELQLSTLEGHALFGALRLARERAGRRKA